MKINLENDIPSQKFPIFVSEIKNIGIEVLLALMNPNIFKSSNLCLFYTYVSFFYGLDLEFRHNSSHFRRESDSLSAAAAQ